ncbi:MAG: hypothetical protein O7H41_05430 [Planctomycetota bacterium]|nr:hypothetical protein [Planctomycetota bacterium]
MMLGVFTDEDKTARLSQERRRKAFDEHRLRKSAREYDCDFRKIRRLQPEGARRALLPYLRRRTPVLLRIDRPDHWVALVGAERGKILLLDSIEPSALCVASWNQLRRRWVVEETRTANARYDFFPVIPRFRVLTRPNLSLGHVRQLRRRENRDIAHFWNDYVADLLDIGRVRSAQSEKVRSLGEFLARHEGMILDQVEHWHGGLDRRRAERVIRHLRFVADTLGMVISRKELNRAIASTAVLLTLWAEGERKGKPIYRKSKPRSRS